MDTFCFIPVESLSQRRFSNPPISSLENNSSNPAVQYVLADPVKPPEVLGRFTRGQSAIQRRAAEINPIRARTWSASRTISQPATVAVPELGLSNVARIRNVGRLARAVGAQQPINLSRLTSKIERHPPHERTPCFSVAK